MSLWWLNLKSVVFQSLIDLVDSLLTLLGEADMKRTGIGDVTSFHQAEYQTIVVEKHGETLVAALVA